MHRLFSLPVFTCYCPHIGLHFYSFLPALHSCAPVFLPKDALSETLFSLWIHTSRCSHNWSHFLSFLPWHWGTPVLLQKDAFSLTLLSLSILIRRYFHIQSHFPSFFTQVAYPYTAVLAYDPNFSLALHSHMPLFNHPNTFLLLLLSYAIPHTAFHAYDPIFTTITVAIFAHTIIDTYEHFFTLARHIHTLLFLLRIVFSQLFPFIPFSNYASRWVLFCYFLKARRDR